MFSLKSTAIKDVANMNTCIYSLWLGLIFSAALIFFSSQRTLINAFGDCNVQSLHVSHIYHKGPVERMSFMYTHAFASFALSSFPTIILPGWHSVSTRGSAARGRVLFMSYQHTRVSARTPRRLEQNSWEYWERWTRATAETCSCTTASSACCVTRRLGLQVNPPPPNK